MKKPKKYINEWTCPYSAILSIQAITRNLFDLFNYKYPDNQKKNFPYLLFNPPILMQTFLIISYLTGDQLTSQSSPSAYRAAIMAGARLVESMHQKIN